MKSLIENFKIQMRGDIENGDYLLENFKYFF